MASTGWGPTVCCFCYQHIASIGDEPVEIHARGARDEGEQSLLSHLECFKRALHPRIPIAVALGSDEEDSDDEDTDPTVEGKRS